MAYRIVQFDGLALPETIRSGDSQRMGSGSAQSSFQALPGGAWYRARRKKRSILGIQPITKSCLLWGTAAELQTQIEALRAKLGVLGKLTYRYDTGVLRWVWAELTEMDDPRPSEAKSGWLPVTLTWVSAAQYLYGTVQGNGWSWGDGTWTWGDGSAAFGQNQYTYSLSNTTTVQPITVHHAGSVPALNVRFELDWSTGNSNLSIHNASAGYTLDYVAGAVSSNATLIVDTAARHVFDRDNTTLKTITSIVRYGTSIIVVTGSAHGLSTGQHVQIRGTQSFDGFYTNVFVLSPTSFSADAGDLDLEVVPDEATGTMTRVYDVYNNLFPGSRNRWFALAPGNNTLQIQFGASAGTKTLRIAFYDHYA